MRRPWWAILLLVSACGGSPPAGTAETVSGRARLEGLSDNSGIFVLISGSRVSESSEVTGADGSWAFTAGSSTRAFLSAYAPSTKETFLETYVDVPSSSGVSVPDLVFTPVGSIVGTVSVAGGSAEGATVAAEGTDIAATTDASGSYRLDGLPAGTYTLRISLAGHPAVSVANQQVSYKGTTSAPPTQL